MAPGAGETRDIATPHDYPVAENQTGHESEYKLFSEDLSRGAVEPFGATPLSPLATEYTPYLRQASDAPSTPALPYPGNVPEETEFGGIEAKPENFENTVVFVTATPDLGHVLLGSRPPPSPPTSNKPSNPAPRRTSTRWSAGSLTLVSPDPRRGRRTVWRFHPRLPPRIRNRTGLGSRQRQALSGTRSQTMAPGSSGPIRKQGTSTCATPTPSPAAIPKPRPPSSSPTALSRPPPATPPGFSYTNGDLYRYDTQTQQTTDLTTGAGSKGLLPGAGSTVPTST